MSRAPKSIKSARQILKGANHILHSLVSQTEKLSLLQTIVEQYVDDEVSVSSLENNELTLTTPSNNTATKLRYRQRNIMSALRRNGLDVEKLAIKVQPSYLEPQVEGVNRVLSKQSANQLQQTAQHIEDGPLREALIRLSKRAN